MISGLVVGEGVFTREQWPDALSFPEKNMHPKVCCLLVTRTGKKTSYDINAGRSVRLAGTIRPALEVVEIFL